ncbi:MAG TPA: hypothetical protein VMW48_03215, partial [Vicinamibacterales bacterium]|nr:hypothetical protein [Vicinamibacterales bacterium]
VIRDYAVITRGEALGHGMWIDSAFLREVVQAGNSGRVKSRFTHPDMCSDGLGTFLGRARGFRLDGDVVRADLHFADSTAKSPRYERDPAEYVMALAVEDPEAFGTSIVFKHDRGAESRHQAQHADKDGIFHSPDPENELDYPHARLAQLIASDIVDDPAANPGGFFSEGDDLTARASAAVDYLFGRTEVEPMPGTFGRMDADSARAFLTGYMAHRGLCIQTIDAKEPTMGLLSRKKPETEVDESVTEAPATLAEMDAEFPGRDKFIVECLREARTVEAARSALASTLTEDLDAAMSQIEDLKRKFEDVEADARTKDDQLAAATKRIDELTAAAAENETLKAEMADLKAQVLDGAEPHSHADEPKPGETTLFAAAKAYETEHPGVKYEDCVHAVLKEHPELDGR